MSVYVVQERKRFNSITKELEPVVNLTPAAKYGDLVELFDNRQHALLTGPTVKTLKNKLRGFDDDDYILPIGDPILIAMATSIAAWNNMGKVKMLHWDRELKQYVVLNYELY